MTRNARGFERKNLIVDAAKVRRLRKLLGASSDSAAIRRAVDWALDGQAAIAALERLRKRGTLGKALAS